MGESLFWVTPAYVSIFGIMYGKILKNGVIRAGVKGAGVKRADKV